MKQYTSYENTIWKFAAWMNEFKYILEVLFMLLFIHFYVHVSRILRKADDIEGKKMLEISSKNT